MWQTEYSFKDCPVSNLSTTHYNTNIVDRDKMIKACDALNPNLADDCTE